MFSFSPKIQESGIDGADPFSERGLRDNFEALLDEDDDAVAANESGCRVRALRHGDGSVAPLTASLVRDMLARQAKLMRSGPKVEKRIDQLLPTSRSWFVARLESN